MNLLTNGFGIKEFILRITSFPEDIQLENLRDRIAQLEFNDRCLDSYIRFSQQSYQRQLVYRGTEFEILVLSWLPGQVSSIHDHGDSLNVTRVYRGTLTSRSYEATYDRSELSTLRLTQKQQLSQGEIEVIDRYSIHQLANTSSEELVTLHVYSRPLCNIRVYCPEARTVEQVIVM